jgi:hypothetical protein
MKKYIPVSIFALILTFPVLAFGQWDYNQNAIDNIIDSRIDRRKTSKRIRARNGKGGTANQRKTSTRNGTSPVKNTVATTPSVSFLRDSYQDFHLDDDNGYLVNFIFVSVESGKTISKSYNYSYYRGLAEFSGIPAGVYTVKASALYNGKKFTVHLGSRDGSSSNPDGGDFAPSIKIEVKAETDDYGTIKMKTFPETLYTRVIE